MRFRVVLALAGLSAVSAAAQTWLALAGNPARTGIAGETPHSLQYVLWSAASATDEEFISASPVTAGGKVFIAARAFDDFVHVENRVIAFDAWTGTRLWTAAAEADWFDSRSSPAIDPPNGTVIYASGRNLIALRRADGSPRWSRQLDRIIVNCSPVVTTGLMVAGAASNRALICDYSGGGSGAKLYAVNVDPFDAARNPYSPGQVVWAAPISGGANSPACANGIVFVSTARGYVSAFSAVDGAPLWSRDLLAGASEPRTEGFYGGLTVRSGAVYVASYKFDGGQNNSRLFKLAASTGAAIWDTPCERTDTIPVVTDDGLIYLAGGIDGYGSAVKVQAFRDLGASAQLVWDTHAATSGTLEVGGWSTQPLFDSGWLFVGRPGAAGPPALYEELFLLDVTRMPGSIGFVVDSFAGAGESPAVHHGVLYSIGSDGLFAFAPGAFEPPTQVDTIQGYGFLSGGFRDENTEPAISVPWLIGS